MTPIVHPVFVILPLYDSEHVKKVFDEGIAPALARFGFEAKRVDDQAIRGGIIDAIHRQIRESYFVIADLSFERQNCYYEVGYAQALGKPVFLCKTTGADVHFNIANQMVHSFGSETPVENLISQQIPKFLETTPRHSDDNRNGKHGRRCIRDGFRLTAKVDECSSNRCTVTLEVCTLESRQPFEGSVKFYMHKEYVKKTQTIRMKDGVARYESVSANGPWTVGAEIVETQTQLELDLTTIPGARDWWYRKAYAAL